MFSPHHVAISVTDLECSKAFYEKLEFHEVMRWQAEDGSLTIVQMSLGPLLLEMFCYASSKQGDIRDQTLESDLKRVGTKHMGLKVSDIEAARKELIKFGLMDESITVIRGRTGIDYLFLRDPDGLFVEIVQDDRGFLT